MGLDWISREAFATLVGPLIGRAIVRPWKGCGSALFLEIGVGDKACIAPYWDWRIETKGAIRLGSDQPGIEIREGIASLQGTTITGIALEEGVPELTLDLSHGERLRTFTRVASGPQWHIKLPSGEWVAPQGGALWLGANAAPALQPEDAAAADREEAAARRWTLPTAEAGAGACHECLAYVRIDGQGHLSDFGVCTAPDGPHDGRAVHRNACCALFQSRLREKEDR